MIPAWSPIDLNFNREKIYAELFENGVFEKSMVATATYNEKGNSIWDPDSEIFSEDIFKAQRLAPHYKEKLDTSERQLISGSLQTFRMLNLTYTQESSISMQDAWEGSIKNSDRQPLWIKYQGPWSWRSDLQIPYTIKVIESLPFEYLLTVRCILQAPPSIGIVHKDNGFKSNQNFFERGFASITINVSSGGAGLWFVSHRDGRKHYIAEDKYSCWHFDDSNLHCTPEVSGIRVQLRVFGKLKVPYPSLMKMEDSIF